MLGGSPDGGEFLPLYVDQYKEHLVAKLLLEREIFKSNPAQHKLILNSAWVKMAELAYNSKLNFRVEFFAKSTKGKCVGVGQKEFTMNFINVFIK